jgi:hypothetical protein
VSNLGRATMQAAQWPEEEPANRSQGVRRCRPRSGLRRSRPIGPRDGNWTAAARVVPDG